MARLRLKNILDKKNDNAALIISFIEQLKANIYVEDEHGKVLLGNANGANNFETPIKLEEEIIGWVKGDDKTSVIGSLLDLLIQKEYERKKLGNEVLTLYQEVNLIFNFSEKLAETIDPFSIAAITLDEGRHLIKFDSGIIVLWDNHAKQLQILALSGEVLFNQEKLNAHVNLLHDISLSGQSEIMGDMSALKEAGIIIPEVQSLIYAALKVKHRVMGAIILASNEAIQYSAADLKFLVTLALQSSSAIESALLYEKNIKEAKEKEEAMRRIFEITNKFVPYEFIGSLGRNAITDVRLGDQIEKIVTVLFSDIRDYTTLAEQMTPEENFRFISSFNEMIGPIIRGHKGFINQYLGDAIMAVFPDNAADALAAAVQMQLAVEEFNQKRISKNLSPIQIGIGMHTGPLIMGITGDSERLDATTIADSVNTASRLESLTKYYKASIIFSESTLQQMLYPETFHIRYLGMVQLKGKHLPVSIYECFNGNSLTEIEKKKNTLQHFNEAMLHYHNKSFASASEGFQYVLEINPHDHTAKFFLDNTIRFINSGVPENWSGVEEMSRK